MSLIRISAPHFCAGVVLNEHDIAVHGAPILRYMVGWNGKKIFDYCRYKRWVWEKLS